MSPYFRDFRGQLEVNYFARTCGGGNENREEFVGGVGCDAAQGF
jgi:hypothetical protein